jgi:hypothetical protein
MPATPSQLSHSQARGKHTALPALLPHSKTGDTSSVKLRPNLDETTKHMKTTSSYCLADLEVEFPSLTANQLHPKIEKKLWQGLGAQPSPYLTKARPSKRS